MKNLIILLVAIMFTLVGVASAGSGTVNDPYTIRYVGYTYTLGGETYTSMGNFTGLISAISNDTGNTVYYNNAYSDIRYVGGVPNTTDINAARNFVAANGTYDYLIVDMFFLNSSYIYPNVTTSYWSFYNACNNTTAAKGTASIFSDDGTRSYAPVNLNFRDATAYTTNSNSSTPKFQEAVNNTDPFNPSYSMYCTFLSYLN